MQACNMRVRLSSPPHSPTPCRALQDGLSDAAMSQAAARAAAEVAAWFGRIDSVVVGVGLGRDVLMLETARLVMKAAREAQLPMVLDGDALFLVAREPELVTGYPLCLLTPNLNELRRLASAMGLAGVASHSDHHKRLQGLVDKLGGPTVVSKGPTDVILDGRATVVCSVTGSPRRCGFQGCILSGVLAVFVAWTAALVEASLEGGEALVLEMNVMVLSAFGACATNRLACACAYADKRRSMLASDMLNFLGSSVELLEGDSARPVGQGGSATTGAVGGPRLPVRQSSR
uniref:YjeF C-terminal domain-containing protein n=1 Tax=Chlamydomonas euryale TaxID=1486919 RepID=A0A7R9YQW7_9CHLO|mmetsp:Transcript_13100/g.38105  ORF Transcript_13100/g.38105 Transcript_13100/m.38105 type:complete len:289 (+) Transcript_13100:128-994(+)